MKIETLNVSGIKEALYAMRHPFQSYDKSDSYEIREEFGVTYVVGEKDRELSKKLANAGPEHAKHLRFIMVWADVTMPFYLLKELDTYKIGVEKLSTSTMHNLTSRPLERADFQFSPGMEQAIDSAIRALNMRMHVYKALKANGEDEQAKEVWLEIVGLLPSCYLQKRTYMFSYAALRNIIKQRTGHRLREWQYFIDWCRTLPETWMLFE